MKRHTQEDMAGFARDLGAMHSDTLTWIYDQIYDPADAGMKKMIENIFDERHAEEVVGWPSYKLSEGENAPIWVQRLGGDHLVAHCPSGDSPSDAQHQPQTRNPLTRGIRCSCGRVTEHDFAVTQRVGSALVWPTETIDGIPHFVICSHARYADDPKHAPRNSGAYGDYRCICRYALNEESTKKLPAY